MAFALSKKEIKCPNCKFEGVAEIRGAGGMVWVLAIALIFLGLFVWPLIVLGVILSIALVFWPARHVCPKCKWENPIPAD